MYISYLCATIHYSPDYEYRQPGKIDGLTREDMLDIIRMASHFEEHPNHRILEGKVVATLF